MLCYTHRNEDAWTRNEAIIVLENLIKSQPYDDRVFQKQSVFPFIQPHQRESSLLYASTNELDFVQDPYLIITKQLLQPQYTYE